MAVRGENRIIGGVGENRAAAYLKKKGYKILARNFRCKLGEVDVIAEKEDVVAFVEVKTRTSDLFGQPGEAVDALRRKRYINCARFFFRGKEIDKTVRFDVIEVTFGGGSGGKGGVEVNHIENAFDAS